MRPTSRTWAVVGYLCTSEKAARRELLSIRSRDPVNGKDWGLVRLRAGENGEGPVEVGKLRLPVPPMLLTRLETLLSDREVRRTAGGREALQAVQAALKKRR